MAHISCKYCNSNRLQIRPGKAPHFRSLYCLDCGKFAKWVSKAAYRDLSDRFPEMSQGELGGLS